MTSWARKDILGIAGLAPEEILEVLDTAATMKEISTRAIKKVPVLRGKTVVNLFFEPSTRTRVSFEIAEKRLSADAVKHQPVGIVDHEGRDSRRHRAKPRREAARRRRPAPLRLGRSGVTAASVVIHYDRWWNQAREDQATDRVHRIGQTRGVQVFKLVTAGTLEEKISALIEKKKNLMDQIVREDDPGLLKFFSWEELLDLLSDPS